MSGREVVMQKVSVWGTMLMMATAASLGTETVDACNPVQPIPVDELHMPSESGDSLGYAGLRNVEAPAQFQQASVRLQNQRWIF
ncbi:hypothetical protein [Pseudomonas sp. HY7a-MNA-CIBAN-0227]|uniref:hypothetical protein n=2 Tax=Pseudomonas TaxID=286 RepID=UPI00331D3EEB